MLDRFRRNTSKKSTASMESKEEEKTKGSSASSPRTSRDVDHAWQLEDEKDEEVRQVRASSPGLAASPQSAGTSSKELPDVLIPSGASLLEGLRLLLVHHLRSSAGSDQINLTAGQAELLEHHLERLSSYAQKIVHTLAFATRFLPQDRSEGDREAHEVEVRSEVSRGGASDPRPQHEVDVKVAAAPKRSTLRLKDRELLQIYRGAQMEACLEADWRGLVTPRTTARSDMSLYSDSSTRPESLTGDDRARVLRTLSEAMRAPGRTPSVLAAEIVETSQDTGCGCQSQKARAARKVAAAAGIGWPQPPPDPGQRRPD